MAVCKINSAGTQPRGLWEGGPGTGSLVSCGRHQRVLCGWFPSGHFPVTSEAVELRSGSWDAEQAQGLGPDGGRSARDHSGSWASPVAHGLDPSRVLCLLNLDVCVVTRVGRCDTWHPSSEGHGAGRSAQALLTASPWFPRGLTTCCVCLVGVRGIADGVSEDSQLCLPAPRLHPAGDPTGWRLHRTAPSVRA